jgi:phosphopentomutase
MEKDVSPGTNYGTRSTFADVGQTVAKVFNVGPLKAGIAYCQSKGEEVSPDEAISF